VTPAGPVYVTVSDGVGHIRLNRPGSANTFDLAMATAFATVVDRCASDDVRCILVTGEGTRFCAGGDVKSFLAGTDPQQYLQDLATVLEAALRRLGHLPKPVVAAVHGAVAGAGLAFVLTADLVVSARDTKFAMAYAGIGLTPDCGVSYLLPRIVGMRHALDFTLNRRTITAEEALQWGLISDLADEPLTSAAEIAQSLANGPSHALGQSRRLLRLAYELPRDAHAREEVASISSAVVSPEAVGLIEGFIRR
jgi:2-(1,2-epoxy-1,2-dihydrophenyl)acetyl-CoA isomerase